jgi:heme-degrading monooxygenase HmoA
MLVLTFAELDETVKLADQMSGEVGPVVLFNLFTVPSEVEGAYIIWLRDAAMAMRELGYISTQFYRGIGGSHTYLNVAVWESVSSFRNAFTNPDFRSAAQRCPNGVTARPHLLQTLTVPGICIGTDGETVPPQH